MKLTRRSLLRAAALPLVFPGRAIAGCPSMGALCSAVPVPSGCIGTPITAVNPTQMTGPGTYCLQNDVSAINFGNGGSGIDFSNIILDGGNHQVTGFCVVGPNSNTWDKSGLAFQNITVGPSGASFFGNNAQTPTAVALRLTNVTFLAPTSALFESCKVTGSNVLVENCTVTGSSSFNDDPATLYQAPPSTLAAAYVTYNNCYFGPNYDLGFEGIGTWDHVTIKNCTAHEGAAGGIGGYYGFNFPSDHSIIFKFTNCTFTGNTISTWRFAPIVPDGSLLTATSDAQAMSFWGANGNVFSGNIYV